jgi:hypothetical protein
MSVAQELNKRWEVSSRQPVASEMLFDRDFLVLGAATRLAKVGAPLDEQRLITLLTAAHGHPIVASSLRHIRHALEKKRDGDLVLALIYLALSGAAKLQHPKEDARRLFLADALMSDGVESTLILNELGVAPLSLDRALDKYNPDQPRVPAGSPDGGQWTSGGWEGGSSGTGPARTSGVQAADALATRGHEVETDATPTAPPQTTTTSPPGGLSTADPNGRPFELAQADLDQSCSAFIAANCKARILRVFPGQYLECSLREVQAAAKAGDAAARRAWKLLGRPEYRK